MTTPRSYCCGILSAPHADRRRIASISPEDSNPCHMAIHDLAMDVLAFPTRPFLYRSATTLDDLDHSHSCRVLHPESHTAPWNEVGIWMATGKIQKRNMPTLIEKYHCSVRMEKSSMHPAIAISCSDITAC